MKTCSILPQRDLSNLDALPQILRIDEVATILARSKSCIYGLIASHKLPAIRPFEGSPRILGVRREALLNLIGEKGVCNA